MGAIWTKTETEWKSGLPYIRVSNGWVRALRGYRKTGPTTWSDLFVLDTSPPAPPSIVSVVVTADTALKQGRLNITVKAPANTDMDSVRVKVGKTVSSNNSTDANYVATIDGTGLPWSEWKLGPNAQATKSWPLSGNLTNGATYVVTAWAMDRTRNYSTPVNKSVVYKTPTTIIGPTITTVLSPTDSRTINKSNNAWNTSDKFLRTGGPYNQHGLWFYSTRFASYIKGAKSIQSMSLQVQRYPYGTVEGQFKLFAHKMENQAAVSVWSPNQVVATDTILHKINPSQTINIPIPTAWYSRLMSGEIKGFGVFTNTSPGGLTDPLVTALYGYGTFSGRVTAVYTK